MGVTDYRSFMEELTRASGPTFQRWESFLSNHSKQLPTIFEQLDQEILGQIRDEQVLGLIWRRVKTCHIYENRRPLMSACQDRLQVLAGEASKLGHLWLSLIGFFVFLLRLAQLVHLSILISVLFFLLNPPEYSFAEQPFFAYHLVFWLSYIAVKVFSRLIWRVKTERQPFYFKNKKSLALVLAGVGAAVLTILIGGLFAVAISQGQFLDSETPFLMLFVYLMTAILIVPLWNCVPQKQVKPSHSIFRLMGFVLGFIGQLAGITVALISPSHHIHMLYFLPYLLLFCLWIRWRYRELVVERYQPTINRTPYHITRLSKRLCFALWFSSLLLLAHQFQHSTLMEMGELITLVWIYLFWISMAPLVIKFILKDDLLYLEKGQDISWSNDLVYLIYRGVYGYRKSASPQVNSWLESYRFWHCVEHQGLGRALQHDFFIEHVEVFHQQLERWECSYAADFFKELIAHLRLADLPKSERKISTLKTGAEQFMTQGDLLVQKQEDILLQQILLIKWHLHQDYRALKADFKFAEVLE